MVGVPAYAFAELATPDPAAPPALLPPGWVPATPTAPATNPDSPAPPFDIVFPVAGPVSFTDSFLSPRGDDIHEAQDLMGTKLEPIVAAHDGVVAWMDNLEATPGGAYMISIRHPSVWETWYIHINNANPGSDAGTTGFA